MIALKVRAARGACKQGGVETCRARATLTNLTSLRRVSNSPRHHDTFRVQPGRRVRDSVRRRADSAEGAKRSDDHPQRDRCAVTRVEKMLRSMPGVDVTRLPDGNYRLRI